MFNVVELPTGFFKETEVMNIIKNTLYLSVATFAIIGGAPQVFAQTDVKIAIPDEQMPMAVEKSSNDHKADSHSAVADLKYLKHTESKYICMVNNKLFDKVQIPTEVNGKTYYGCCSMCKAKLEKSQELREAIDPVSGVIVDKASAIIGTSPEGVAYYFENEENMKQFDDLKSSKL